MESGSKCKEILAFAGGGVVLIVEVAPFCPGRHIVVNRLRDWDRKAKLRRERVAQRDMESGREFVEASVAHQLGDPASRILSLAPHAQDFAQAVSSKMSLAWDHAGQSPLPLNDWAPARDQRPVWRVKNSKHRNAHKVIFALRDVLHAGADFDFLIDMQDHRTRNLITPDGVVAPVLSFNRPIGKTTGHILWPLPHYHDVDGSEFLGHLDPNRVAWRDKKDIAVWRGGPGNRGRLRRGGNPIRMRPLLQRYQSGALSREDTLTILTTMPRYRFLNRWIDDPRFDIGYTNSDGFVLAEEPFLDVLERPKIPRENFQDYKYIFVLPGSDVGSSFYWTMNSGSVGLVIDCDFETFASHHFKPWEHYVPVRRDQANIDRAMRWCARNQDECQAMAKRAQEVCKYLADGDLRDQVCRGVVKGIRQQLVAAQSE